MTLLQMSGTGAVLILMITVLRALTVHRLPKRTFLILWSVAVLRLLVPVSVPSALSAYALLPQTAVQAQVPETPVAPDAACDSGCAGNSSDCGFQYGTGGKFCLCVAAAVGRRGTAVCQLFCGDVSALPHGIPDLAAGGKRIYGAVVQRT